jgi:hypothetical protein
MATRGSPRLQASLAGMSTTSKTTSVLILAPQFKVGITKTRTNTQVSKLIGTTNKGREPMEVSRLVKELPPIPQQRPTSCCPNASQWLFQVWRLDIMPTPITRGIFRHHKPPTIRGQPRTHPLATLKARDNKIRVRVESIT